MSKQPYLKGGTHAGITYPPWPVYGGSFYDTVGGCVSYLEYLAWEMAKEEPSLWASIKYVASWIGIPSEHLRDRVAAAERRMPPLWPWSKIRVKEGEFQLFAPDLCTELLWITSHDAPFLLGTDPKALSRPYYQRYLQKEHRPFRGTAKNSRAVYFPSLLYLARLIKLRRLFGKRGSLQDYEALALLSAERIAHIRLSPLRPTALKE